MDTPARDTPAVNIRVKILPQSIYSPEARWGLTTKIQAPSWGVTTLPHCPGVWPGAARGRGRRGATPAPRPGRRRRGASRRRRRPPPWSLARRRARSSRASCADSGGLLARAAEAPPAWARRGRPPPASQGRRPSSRAQRAPHSPARRRARASSTPHLGWRRAARRSRGSTRPHRRGRRAMPGRGRTSVRPWACACRGGSGHVVSELRPPCPPLARRELACARVVWRPGRYYWALLPGCGTRVASCGASEVRCVPWGEWAWGLTTAEHGAHAVRVSRSCSGCAAGVPSCTRSERAQSVHGACSARAAGRAVAAP